MPVPPHVSVTAGSIAERWATLVLSTVRAEQDPKTISTWARFVGVSRSTLCECCRLVRVPPRSARDFARLMRAIYRSGKKWQPETVLDLADARTLKKLLSRAGLIDPVALTPTLPQFLDQQQWIPSDNPGLQALRRRLLPRCSAHPLVHLDRLGNGSRQDSSNRHGGDAMLTTGRTVMVAAAVMCLLGPALASAPQVDGRFERTLTVTAPVDLTISSGAGSIDIRPGSDGTIHVVGRIHISEPSLRGDADILARVHQIEQQPPIEQSGGQVHIGDTEDAWLRANISISYDVTVPVRTSVTSHSGSGSQDIGAVAGPVHAKAGPGSLRMGAIGGAVNARSSSGRLTVEGAKGSAELSTSSGHISLRGANGSVTARTSSGGIDVSGKPDANWTLSSHSGGVWLNVPAGTPFTLDARTHSGGFNIEHPITVNSSTRRLREIQSPVNGGGPTVSISTTSGHIFIGAR